MGVYLDEVHHGQCAWLEKRALAKDAKGATSDDSIWKFPWATPIAGWFISGENPLKMDENWGTPICGNQHIWIIYDSSQQNANILLPPQNWKCASSLLGSNHQWALRPSGSPGSDTDCRAARLAMGATCFILVSISAEAISGWVWHGRYGSAAPWLRQCSGFWPQASLRTGWWAGGRDATGEPQQVVQFWELCEIPQHLGFLFLNMRICFKVRDFPIELYWLDSD